MLINSSLFLTNTCDLFIVRNRQQIQNQPPPQRMMYLMDRSLHAELSISCLIQDLIPRPPINDPLPDLLWSQSCTASQVILQPEVCTLPSEENFRFAPLMPVGEERLTWGEYLVTGKTGLESKRGGRIIISKLTTVYYSFLWKHLKGKVSRSPAFFAHL